jgi:hypothetical protein
MSQMIWMLLLLAACALPCVQITRQPLDSTALATSGLIGVAFTCAAAIQAGIAA